MTEREAQLKARANVRRVGLVGIPQDGWRSAVRDLAARRAYQQIGEHGRNPRVIRRVQQLTCDDYDSFSRNPTAMRDAVLPKTYTMCMAPRGMLSGIITSVLINIIAKAVTRWLLRQWKGEE